MIRFVSPLEKPAYFEQILVLYRKYSKFLEDDFASDKIVQRKYLENLIIRTNPYFWAITEDDVVSGFVYLDNLIGNDKKLHSAELTTCFDKRFWGNYTKMCACLFFNHVFKKYEFEKIKALVYPENFRVKNLLRFAGFEKEALLKKETLRGGKLQDIEVYSIFKERI